MKKILILFAHPALEKSRVNRQLIAGLDKIEGVTFHDLYQLYPEYDIDVTREQELLQAHDLIAFQHPFFWYSTPAILKEWQDLVLEHNWAYGKNGNALQGKFLFNVITTGGRFQAYQPDGYNRFTIRQFLAPLEQTAYLCKMQFLPPFVVHGTHAITAEAVETHRKQYHQLLIALRDETVDLTTVRNLNYLNDSLSPSNSKG